MGDNVITFQGHPEFRKGYSRSLIDYRREILGKQVHTEGLDSLEKSTDESLVGHWIQRFLLGKGAENDADRKTAKVTS